MRENLFGKKLSQGQVDGMEAILTEWERGYQARDPRWLAYMLATTYHETDKTMQPIEEYGKGDGRSYGAIDPKTGKAYYGRGFVQLTWKSNYQTMGDRLGLDLVNNPELALDLEIATKILFVGMIAGLFTGRGLDNYFCFCGVREDWVNARRIINGLDKAELIAGYGKSYYAALGH